MRDASDHRHSDRASSDHGAPRPWRLPDACNSDVQRLFAETPADHWHLSFQSFYAALSRGAIKRFGDTAPPVERIREYLATLHARDLALACACGDGSENAWNDFVAECRGYLHIAAAAILKRRTEDPAAVELADSVFADLYGISGGKAGGRSLFRYFHGRSSLKTWLRAVLAQRHIDALRAGKKFDSLDEIEPGNEIRARREPSVVDPPADPHRESYLARFRQALALALQQLASKDRQRLQLYYVRDCTLAEIGRKIGEHESSVSRNLDRVRKELRSTVEGLLRAGKAAANGGPADAGMDNPQLDQCFRYAAEDAGLDLDKLLRPQPPKDSGGPKREAQS